QPADRHRLLLDPSAPAGRLARTVAGAPENSREHVRLPIDHVGVGIALRRDQPDIFRHRRMGRTGPLAIHHLVEIFGIRDLGRLHYRLSPSASLGLPRPSGYDGKSPDAKRSTRWRISLADISWMPRIPHAWSHLASESALCASARQGSKQD